MKLKQTLQNFRETTAVFWTARRAFIAVALPGLTLALLLFLSTSVGQTLNTAVFVKPTMKLRSLWRLEEGPAKNLRIVVYDDSSAEALSRPPTINDWIGVANHLAALGYKKVIFPEIFELPAEAGSTPLSTDIELIAGSAVHSRHFKTNATTPPGLIDISQSGDSEVVRATPAAGDILHAEQLSDIIGHSGGVNLSGDYEVRAGYRVSTDRFIPHVAFFAAPELRASGDHLTSRAGVLPVKLNGSMFIEMLDPAQVARISVPVRSFYSKTQPGLRQQLPSAVREALAGGDIALLVADGNTGSAAFIDSFAGLVPTYYANASLISAVMHERFLRALPGQGVVILLLSLMLVIAGLILKPLRCISIICAAWLATLTVSALLFHFSAQVAPVAQLSVIFLVLLLAEKVQHSFHSWQDDMRRQRDLELGKVVQSLTLPSRMKGQMDGWEFAVAYEPYGPMSGDWVQIYENRNPDHEICGIVAIGDVVGKGPAAALNTASIAALWSHFRNEWDEGHFDILNFLNTLNKNIHSTFGGNQTTSVAVAILHKDKVQLINCGSPTWIHISPETKVESVRIPPSNPLGLADGDFTFQLKELELKPGSILLAHTDGVMEGGLARKNFARNVIAAGLPEDNAFAYLQREARIAGADTVLPDDFTMLYLKRCA
jgi:hypothetical protein